MVERLDHELPLSGRDGSHSAYRRRLVAEHRRVIGELADAAPDLRERAMGGGPDDGDSHERFAVAMASALKHRLQVTAARS
jgi:hypothetical protein